MDNRQYICIENLKFQGCLNIGNKVKICDSSVDLVLLKDKNGDWEVVERNGVQNVFKEAEKLEVDHFIKIKKGYENCFFCIFITGSFYIPCDSSGVPLNF